MRCELYCSSIFYWYLGLYWLFLWAFLFYLMEICYFSWVLEGMKSLRSYCPRIALEKHADFRWFSKVFNLNSISNDTKTWLFNDFSKYELVLSRPHHIYTTTHIELLPKTKQFCICRNFVVFILIKIMEKN